MLDRITCPESSELPGLLAGTGSAADLLFDHLADCPQCQDALDRLAAGEFDWLRHPSAPAARPGSLRAAMDTLKAAPPTVGGEEPPPADPAAVLSLLAPTHHPGAIGAVGPYPVLGVIGRGGMGVVFKAIDRALNRVVAVKVLAPEWAANGTARRRFSREARAAAAVAHENVVTVHAVEDAGGLPFLVMEYVEGASLQEVIDRDGPLDPTDALRIGLQLADGLAAAHRKGLVHRDVKPANILLEDGFGRVKLSDFGLARAVDDAGWTTHGTVLGTPEYMAPEQAAGGGIDARADLFSLGAVMYAVLAGRPPFRAASALGVLHQVTTGTPLPLRAVRPDVPPPLESVVMKLLAKNPADRFPSASAAADEFRRVRDWMERSDEDDSDRRRAGAWVAVAAAALFAVAAGVVLKFATDRGTLVVEIDDPAGSVKVEKDGESVIVTGAGIHELRLKPGEYRATQGGKPVPEEIVTVERNGQTVLRAKFEPPTGVAGKAPATEPPTAMKPVLPSAVPAPRLVREFEGSAGAVRGIAVTPDGQRVVSVTGFPHGDGMIRAWQITGERMVQFAAPPREQSRGTFQMDGLALTPDGDYAVVGGSDGKVRVHAPRTPGPVREFVGHTADVSCVAVSPDGKRVAAGALDGYVRIWDFATGDRVRTIHAHGERWCRAVAFSPDSNLLASGGLDGAVRIWDAFSGAQLKSFAFPAGMGKPSVWGVAFTDGGKKLIAVGNEGIGHGLGIVYETETGRRLAEFRGHGDGITCVAVSPDGTRAATGSYEGSMRVWDVATGKQLYRADAGVGAVWAVAFTPDGTNVLSGGGGVYTNGKYTAGNRFGIRLWAVGP